jgi:hypothetical protein
MYVLRLILLTNVVDAPGVRQITKRALVPNERHDGLKIAIGTNKRLYWKALKAKLEAPERVAKMYALVCLVVQIVSFYMLEFPPKTPYRFKFHVTPAVHWLRIFFRPRLANSIFTRN